MLSTPTILVSILIVALGIPMARGKVRRNRWYGFRTKATLNSDALWYPANAASGRYLVLAGTVSAIISTLAFNLLSAPTATVLSTIFLIVALFWSVAASFVALAKIISG